MTYTKDTVFMIEAMFEVSDKQQYLTNKHAQFQFDIIYSHSHILKKGVCRSKRRFQIKDKNFTDLVVDLRKGTKPCKN